MRISIEEEWQFLQKCEENTHVPISAKERFLEMLKIINKMPEPKKILDVGGNVATAKWFKAKFPNSEITILNNSKKEIDGCQKIIFADAQSFKLRDKWDLIFAGEIIEHLYNPDGLICSCLSALKPNGYFIITTPNLSCIHNRLFLLLGWSLGNYSPSIRFKTGNPFYRLDKTGNFGMVADHKSVFTYGGLKELVELYGFKTLLTKGYSYVEKEQQAKTLGNQYIVIPWRTFRQILNKIIPVKYREGMLFVLQSPSHIDEGLIQTGFLKEQLWELE